MRLGGILIGFLLAIALAYGHDASVSPRSADGDPQYLVNWDVFGRIAGDAGAWAREQFDRLVDQVRQR